ncbi:MAG: hypothetical protein WD052_00305 [Bacteroidales bacterium]
MRLLILLLICFIQFAPLFAQEEAADYPLMITYGNMSEKGCGDDDFSQTIFFTVPGNFKGDFYMRVFDPDCGGAYDMSSGLWETNTVFEIYGGEGCISHQDARQSGRIGNYKSGDLLQRKLFARESEVDGSWVSFGPFNSGMGEDIKEYPGYKFFKLIVEGRTGNDGNLYALQISEDHSENSEITYARIFTYEHTYFENDSVMVSRTQPIMADKYKVPLPVKLEKIAVELDIEVVAVPVDE